MNRLIISAALTCALLTALSCSSENVSDSTVRISLPSKFMAETVPDIESYTLRITAEDMEPVEKTFSAYELDGDTVNVTVPSGASRLFELTAIPTSYSIYSAAASYYGSATADLEADTYTDVTISMALQSTKIVFPDHFNYDLYMISDMTGTDVISSDTTTFTPDLTYSYYFYPHDVDYDMIGRIYVSTDETYYLSLNQTGSAIYCLNSISSAGTMLNLGDLTYSAMSAIAVDRNSGILYFSTGSTLNSYDISTEEITLDYNINGFDPQNDTISGIAADNDSILYIVINNNAPSHRAIKYNPSTQTIAATYTNLNTPTDVMYQGGSVYISDLGNGETTFNRIVQLSSAGMSFLAEYAPTGDTVLYGPKRFLAVRPEEILFIDEEDVINGTDRIVSINDIDGTGFTVYDNESCVFYFYC